MKLLLRPAKTLIRPQLIFFVMASGNLSRNKIVLLILTLAFVSIIFLGNFTLSLNNYAYSAEFEKLGVNETVASSAVSFVQGSSELGPYFNEKETSHLQDVRGVFTAVKRTYYFFLLALGVSLAYAFRTGKFRKAVPLSMTLSGGISLLLLVVIFMVSLNFSSFFSAIHRPFFESGTWIFPPDSVLIKSFPERFFQDFTGTLFRRVFFNSALFFGIGLFIRKKFKQQEQVQVNDSAKL